MQVNKNILESNRFEKQIKDILLKHFKDIPCRVFLFGSRAEGNNKYNSDYDIGIETLDGSELDLHKYLSAKSELEELLVKVDLVDFATKDDVFREIALKNKVDILNNG